MLLFKLTNCKDYNGRETLTFCDKGQNFLERVFKNELDLKVSGITVYFDVR